MQALALEDVLKWLEQANTMLHLMHSSGSAYYSTKLGSAEHAVGLNRWQLT